MFSQLFSLLKQTDGTASLHAEALLNRSWFHVLTHDYEAADADWHAADDLSKTEGWPGFRWLVRAEIELGRHNPEGALQAFTQAFETARRTGARASDIGWRALYGIGRIYQEGRQIPAAIEVWQQAIDELDLTTRQVGVDAIGGFLRDRIQLAEDLMMALIQVGRMDEAFLIADMSHAHTLQALDAQHRLERLSPEAQAEWTRRIEAYMQLRGQFDPTAEQGCLEVPRDEVEACRAEHAQRERDLQARLDHAYAHLDEHASGIRGAGDIEDIRGALRPGEAILMATAASDGGWHSFWMTADHIDYALPHDDPLAQWRARLDDLDHLFVIGGAESVRHIYSQPADLREPDGPPLAARIGISDLPFAGMLARRGGPLNEGAPVVVGDPTQRYRAALDAGRLAAGHLPGAAHLELEAAHRDQVLARLKRASVFHFSGHAEHAAGDPWTGALVLAGDTSLTTSDVLVQRPKAALAVLAACGTGQEAAVSGRDTLSLATAFLAAGTHTVVATDRAVEAEAARRFVARFYRHGGATEPTVAFRRAVADMHGDGDESWRDWRILGFPHTRRVER